MTEHIVAIFQSEQPAAAAVRELEQAGVPSSAIRKYAATSAGASAPATTTGMTTSGTGSSTTSSGNTSSGSGFWAWVLGEESSSSGSTRDAYPDDDMYGRHYEAGNTIVSVTLTDDSKIHEAITILDAHHPLDIDERTEETNVVPGLESGSRTSVAPSGTDYSSSGTVRASDMTGAAMTGATTAGTSSANVTTGSTSTTAPVAGLTGAATTGTSAGTGATTSGEQVLQLSEEELNIGKRTVERGTTRVRRYVVSRPVEKEVTLHGERVTIERRSPVTSSGPGVGAFEERVVEVRETEEVPVVQKTARVVEEVAIRREATERTETVRDTVRREELEVAPDKTKPGTEPHLG